MAERLRRQLRFERLDCIAHAAARTQATARPAGPVWLTASLSAVKPLSSKSALPSHVVEGQVPALVRSVRATQVHRAGHFPARSCLCVHRQQQVERRACRAAGTQIGQRIAIFLLQRTLAQQGQQLCRIGCRARVDRSAPPCENRGIAALNASTCTPASAPLPCNGKTVADEGDVGIDLIHRRPVGLELELAVVDPGAMASKRPLLWGTASRPDRRTRWRDRRAPCRRPGRDPATARRPWTSCGGSRSPWRPVPALHPRRRQDRSTAACHRPGTRVRHAHARRNPCRECAVPRYRRASPRLRASRPARHPGSRHGQRQNRWASRSVNRRGGIQLQRKAIAVADETTRHAIDAGGMP